MTEISQTVAAAPSSAIAGELRAFVSKIRRRLREQDDVSDLTPSQTSAWSRLEREGPLTVSALARLEGIRSQSMGASVAVLLDAGFIRGDPDPADRRQNLLSVTEAGRDWADAQRRARQDWLTRVIERELSADERADLSRAVALLKRIADA